MPSWFARGLRRGVITTRYPATPDPSAALLPTPPAFIPEHLTAALADLLIAACPSRALRREGATLRYDLGLCTACGRCLRLAGPAAVPSGEFELAATARAALVKHIPLRGQPEDIHGSQPVAAPDARNTDDGKEHGDG